MPHKALTPTIIQDLCKYPPELTGCRSAFHSSARSVLRMFYYWFVLSNKSIKQWHKKCQKLGNYILCYITNNITSFVIVWKQDELKCKLKCACVRVFLSHIMSINATSIRNLRYLPWYLKILSNYTCLWSKTFWNIEYLIDFDRIWNVTKSTRINSYDYL